jgi:hypothetical protein
LVLGVKQWWYGGQLKSLRVFGAVFHLIGQTDFWILEEDQRGQAEQKTCGERDVVAD